MTVRILHIGVLLFIGSTATSQTLAHQPNDRLLESDLTAAKLIELARTRGNNGDIDGCLVLLDSARRLTNDSALLVRIYRIESVSHELKFEWTKSMELALTGLRLLNSRVIDRDHILLHGCLGRFYTLKGEYAQALDHFHAGLTLAENGNHNEEMSVILANMGLAFYKMYDYSLAVKYWEESNALTADANEIAQMDLNIALAFINMGKYDVALEYFRSARQKLQTTQRTDFYYVLGTLYDSLKMPDSALYCFRQSLLQARPSDLRFEAEDRLSIARLMIDKRENSDSVLFLIDRAADIASTNKFVDIAYRCAQQRFRQAKAVGNINDLIYAQQYVSYIWDAYYGRTSARIGALFKAKRLGAEISQRRQLNNQKIYLVSKLDKLQEYLTHLSVILGGGLIVIVSLLITTVIRHLHKGRSLDSTVKQRVLGLEQSTIKIEQILQGKRRWINRYQQMMINNPQSKAYA